MFSQRISRRSSHLRCYACDRLLRTFERIVVLFFSSSVEQSKKIGYSSTGWSWRRRHYDLSKRRICLSTRRRNPEDLNLDNKLQGSPYQLSQWGAHVQLMSRTCMAWRGEPRQIGSCCNQALVRNSVFSYAAKRHGNARVHHLAARQNATVKLWKNIIFWHVFRTENCSMNQKYNISIFCTF